MYKFEVAQRVRFKSQPGEKVASDLGLGGGLHRVLRYPPSLSTD